MTRIIIIVATIWATLHMERQFVFDTRNDRGTGIVFIDHSPRIEDGSESLLLVFWEGQLTGMDASTSSTFDGPYERHGPFYPLMDMDY